MKIQTLMNILKLEWSFKVKVSRGNESTKKSSVKNGTFFP